MLVILGDNVVDVGEGLLERMWGMDVLIGFGVYEEMIELLRVLVGVEYVVKGLKVLVM